MKYTIEMLKEQNKPYDTQYGLTKDDLDMVNNYVKLIESTRSQTEPKTGDALILTEESGDYYDRAHLEFDCFQDENKISYCEHPYVPFVSERKNGIGCSTSGGAWGHIPVNELTYVGTREKKFCDFGGHSARAGGAVYFTANVSVWEYNCNKQPYSTKTHDKYYIYHDNSDNSDYKYTTFDGHAWKNLDDLQAWLRTYRGECMEGHTRGQMLVWAYKEKEVHVSPDEYEALNLPEDIMVMNGTRRCKRQYDDENHLLTTYYVWYWDEPGDFDTVMSRQNEIRKQYELDWRTAKEYELARKDFANHIAEPVDLSQYFRK